MMTSIRQFAQGVGEDFNTFVGYTLRGNANEEQDRERRIQYVTQRLIGVLGMMAAMSLVAPLAIRCIVGLTMTPVGLSLGAAALGIYCYVISHNAYFSARTDGETHLLTWARFRRLLPF